VGDSTRVPERLDALAPEVDVTLELPPDRSVVLVAAPLAYYLPADIRIREDCSPRLLVKETTRETLEDFEEDVAKLLGRIFHLDCLVRREPRSGNSGRKGADDGLLARVGLDPDRLRSLPAAARIDRYLTAWEPRFDDALPEWHLSTAVEPTGTAVRSLPALLDRLSVIVRADDEPPGRPDLLDRTLGDAYRTRGSSGETDVVAPDRRTGWSQGWLAPGRPIEAFKPTPTAFAHRRRYGTGGDADRTVAVVLGDRRMRAEYEDVAQVYRDRGTDATVDVLTSPTRAELLAVFRRGYDLLHYVGHCEDAGLRCTDGHLAVADVAACRTPAFVLNACGSYDEGLALVDRGAVAGAVTFADVLDRHAARVGTALARLLVDGFSVQRALEIARRRILMGQDYAAVGDGTFAPFPDRGPPGVLWVEAATDESVTERDASDEAPASDDEPAIQVGTSPRPDVHAAEAYDVTYDAVTIRRTGDRHPVPFRDEAVLNGRSVSATLSPAALDAVLARGSFPTVWDEDLYWSENL
jgi:hypothetical protein